MSVCGPIEWDMTLNPIKVFPWCFTPLLASFYKIRKSIINKIFQVSFNYLWIGKKSKAGIYLAKWEIISPSKHLRGWGFKHLNYFGCTFVMKSLWRAITDSGLWRRLMCTKSPHNGSLKEWFQSCFALKTSMGCLTWKVLLMALPWVVDGLIWKVSNGNDIILGKITFLGGPSAYHLSHELMIALHSKGIINLGQASDSRNENLLSGKWKTAFDLDI